MASSTRNQTQSGMLDTNRRQALVKSGGGRVSAAEKLHDIHNKDIAVPPAIDLAITPSPFHGSEPFHVVLRDSIINNSYAEDAVGSWNWLSTCTEVDALLSMWLRQAQTNLSDAHDLYRPTLAPLLQVALNLLEDSNGRKLAFIGYILKLLSKDIFKTPGLKELAKEIKATCKKIDDHPELFVPQRITVRRKAHGWGRRLDFMNHHARPIPPFICEILPGRGIEYQPPRPNAAVAEAATIAVLAPLQNPSTHASAPEVDEVERNQSSLDGVAVQLFTPATTPTAHASELPDLVSTSTTPALNIPQFATRNKSNNSSGVGSSVASSSSNKTVPNVDATPHYLPTPKVTPTIPTIRLPDLNSSSLAPPSLSHASSGDVVSSASAPPTSPRRNLNNLGESDEDEVGIIGRKSGSRGVKRKRTVIPTSDDEEESAARAAEKAAAVLRAAEEKKEKREKKEKEKKEKRKKQSINGNRWTFT